MKQPNSTPYVPSSYPNMMDLPFRSASQGPTTPDSCQHSFDESSYFSAMPQEILNFPVSRLAESSLDQWLMDMPGTASPESSRLSMSPSQGIATPPSDGFYSPPYPEQLQLPAYQVLEQPQPLRSCSTSHPNWVNSGDNWERSYAENDLWTTLPFVAQPWVLNTYDGYVLTNMHPSHANDSLPPFTCAAQSQLPLPEAVQTRPATSHEGPPASEDSNEDEDSSDEESDWDEDTSDYSQAGASASRAKPKIRGPRPHIDRWIIPVNTIRQSETRGYVCNVSGCPTSFVRPEHLRRHIRSKHNDVRDYQCVVPGCTTLFSRGDNLRDHYWTHLERGGRNGKNKKFTLADLKVILGPKEKKLVKRLREKLRQHQEKEKLKKHRMTRPAYTERSMP